ncbi:hypothetical protein AB0M39_39820 [Streptomyces sp. NPDC051907]|uniref:hypothetical protein n=1 Tax=Streptomyces sp. NPDC051907 TaxID=3155284 RepID=UPI00343DFFEF
MHAKLDSFLALAEPWASRYAPALAPALVAELNEDLSIGAPLERLRIRNPS